MSDVPDDLRYTTDHEWIRIDGDLALVGITDHAQDALGDVVYADSPDSGLAVASGDAMGEVESTKAVSEIFAPVPGEVVEINPALADTPELMNSDPYGEGWWCRIRLAADADLSHLLDAEGYRAFLATLDE